MEFDTGIVAPPQDAAAITAAPADRRRAGRPGAVSPALVPILRGRSSHLPEAVSVTPKAGPTDFETHGADVKKCAACKDGSAIFPFTMAFQPIVDVQNKTISGYEALARGPNGEGAAHVLKQVTAENTYTFDQACRVKAIELASRLGLDKHLSINFLPNAVYEPRACIQTTLRAASRTGFPRDRLIFEILESETIADTAHLLSIITEYRKYGFQIALDDFGTGYSGLARLAELRPDIVKVDRVLVRDCDKDTARLAIIAGIVAIGHAIDVKVVLEGVERVEEMDALRSVGARFMQGFYFARPAFEAVVRDTDIVWPR